MNKKLFLYAAIMLVIICMLTTNHAFSANEGDVVIYEIAWMGTEASYNDEWIELFNNTDYAISLDNWTLRSSDGAPEIDLSGTIQAHGYFLLERSDDNTISDITADQTYTGVLGNSGEQLFLEDDQENTIDEVNCSEGWFAGDNDTKSSMERKHPTIDGNSASSWATNNGSTINGLDAGDNPINGTPKSQNSVYDSSLPVFLTSFTASVVDEGILVRWHTASELENVGFYLYRSKGSENHFVRISSFIPGAGNSEQPNDYQFTDRDVMEGETYYYQLEDVDINGVKKKHKIISVTYQHGGQGGLQPNSFYISPSFPNPFGERLGEPSTSIRVMVPDERSENTIYVRIFNLLGQEVYRFSTANMRSGTNTFQWQGRDQQGNRLSNSIYFWRVQSEGFDEIRRITLMR